MSTRLPRTPSYRRHKAIGQSVVTLGGPDVYLGPYGIKASEVAYDRAVAEWLVNGRRHVSDLEISVAELVARYVRHVEGYYRSNEPRIIRLALRPSRILYGTTPARDIGPLAIKVVRRVHVSASEVDSVRGSQCRQGGQCSCRLTPLQHCLRSGSSSSPSSRVRVRM